MRRLLPPLNAVRAFEAASRLMSFSAAARELFVSVSAVSQQIRSLEQHLGVDLFKRSPSAGLSLTPAGQMCAPALRSTLDSLAHVFAQVNTQLADNVVTLASSPSLNTSWLPHRAAGFTARHPDISLRIWINRGLNPVDNPVKPDLAIYLGEGNFKGLHVDPLMTETVFPVCSPALYHARPIRKPADLANHTLLCDDTMAWDREATTLGFPDWAAWLAFANVILPERVHEHRIQMSSSVVEFAAEGLGVALGRSRVVDRALQQGRLIRPLALEYPREFSYYLVCDPAALGSHAVSKVRDWLLLEGRKPLRVAANPTKMRGAKAATISSPAKRVS
ncbi:MAG: LysR substrate-binding domain-containing protein [Steroidobacteraceae bacterium]|nr:LysR substrate-binding domain-containing protein [Steroidobacteraceae bacterium]